MGISAQPDLRKVVQGGYCTGCGGCVAVDERIRIELDGLQRLQALLPDDGGTAEAAKVCPFADGNPNEDEISLETFTSPELKNDTRIGRFLDCFGGWVVEGDYRERASSGGMGSWIQAELLSSKLVDAVIDVTQVSVTSGGSPLFRYTVARSIEEIHNNSKTRYYPVEMSGVIKHIQNNPGRYAVIGVPCFAKALRLVARQDARVSERLHFVLAIVCGHMKSAAFADAIAWQCGIKPDELTGIDFRAKLENRPASRYGTTVSGLRNGEELTVTRPMEGLVGSNWGHGLFKLKGCEFCDDVLGETADAVVGDAWLPAYDNDSRGANIVVVREPVIFDLIRRGIDEGRLHLDSLSANDVAASQAGGLRHRRDGLAYRLWLTDQQGKWRPAKRVNASRNHLDWIMQRVHRLRYELGQKSHSMFYEARKSGDLQDFTKAILPIINTYERLMKPSLPQRILNLLHRKVTGVLRYIRHT